MKFILSTLLFLCLFNLAQSFKAVRHSSLISTVKPIIGEPVSNGESMRLNMASGKQAKFGIFSPAVYLAKFALGEKKLNKIRGKAISLHSQAITEWCIFYGAYNLRVKLIKKAKGNGDSLGFLV